MVPSRSQSGLKEGITIGRVEHEQVVLRRRSPGFQVVVVRKCEMPRRLWMAKDPAGEPVPIIEGRDNFEAKTVLVEANHFAEAIRGSDDA